MFLVRAAAIAAVPATCSTVTVFILIGQRISGHPTKRAQRLVDRGHHRRQRLVQQGQHHPQAGTRPATRKTSTSPHRRPSGRPRSRTHQLTSPCAAPARRHRTPLGTRSHRPRPRRSPARRARVRTNPRLGPQPRRPIRHYRLPGRCTGRGADKRQIMDKQFTWLVVSFEHARHRAGQGRSNSSSFTLRACSQHARERIRVRSAPGRHTCPLIAVLSSLPRLLGWR